MDRTMLVPWKAEEKELSEKLYKELQVLTLVYPPSDEFRKCLTDDIFLKPNQTAFFHVMHYLFILLDATEFKKRFYWPITDKRAEANFRTSTVDYLKDLNEKHQLKWTNIKSYLVVKPFGMKFITFMLDFVEFIFLQLIRQREKQLCAEMGLTEIPEINLHHMRRQNEFLKEYASAYITELDEQREEMIEKTRLLGEKFTEMANAIGLTVDEIKSDKFQKEFEISNQEFFKQNYSLKANKVRTLEKPLIELGTIVDDFQSKEASLQFNKDDVFQALQFIQNQKMKLNNENESSASTVQRDDIKMNDLIEAFNNIYDSIQVSLEETNKQPTTGEFVAKELNTLKTDVQQIEVKITDFQKVLNARIKKQLSDERAIDMKTPLHNKSNITLGAEDALLSKFISTPPIHFDIAEGSHVTQKRLPLLDDMGSSTNNLSTFLTARKPKHVEHSFDLNNTLHRSRIISPMQLLRTINKNDKPKTTAQHNVQLLDSKWKERQCVFGNNIESIVTPVKIRVESIINDEPSMAEESLWPTTPFNTNEHTRIAQHTQINNTSGNSNPLPRKLYAVKKVQDESLNILNLSTSPSGRLEPLVAVDINDVLMVEKTMPVPDSSDDMIKDTENVLNANVMRQILLDESGEDLFNISDSVLKDVL